MKKIVRILISAALIYYILRGVPLAIILEAFKQVDFRWVMAAFSLHAVGMLLSALRWRVLLRIQGIQPGIGFLVNSLLVGTFFNNILPGSISGDISRIYDTVKGYRLDPVTAATTILVERLSGLVALFTFAAVALSISSAFYGGKTIAILVALFFALVLLGGAALIAAPAVRVWDKLFNLPVLNKVRKKAQQFNFALGQYRNHKASLSLAFLYAFLLQTNFIIHYYFISKAFPEDMLSVGLFPFFIIIPMVTVLLMIPISIGGIGVRENAFYLFLQNYKATKATAVAFSWIDYGMRLVVGIVGGIVFALRKEKTTEIHRFEEQLSQASAE